jgi:hypothetical protein
VLAFARVDCIADRGSHERARNRAGCAEGADDRRWDWTGRMRRTTGLHSVSAAASQRWSEHSPTSCTSARVAFRVLRPVSSFRNARSVLRETFPVRVEQRERLVHRRIADAAIAQQRVTRPRDRARACVCRCHGGVSGHVRVPARLERTPGVLWHDRGRGHGSARRRLPERAAKSREAEQKSAKGCGRIGAFVRQDRVCEMFGFFF